MKKTTTVYKVVSVWPMGVNGMPGPVWCSAVISPRPEREKDAWGILRSRTHRLSVIYKPGEFVRGKGGTPVTAFSSLHAAETFMREARTYGGPMSQVWRAEAIVLDEGPRLVGLSYLPRLVKDLKALWSRIREDDTSRYVCRHEECDLVPIHRGPPGTVLCSKLKLVERMA